VTRECALGDTYIDDGVSVIAGGAEDAKAGRWKCHCELSVIVYSTQKVSKR
jgi:hypothetical protein